MLKKLGKHIKDDDQSEVNNTINIINKKSYIGEDADFITVLNESLNENDMEKAIELITTYIDLNS